jgi:hypothetical protein
MTYTEEQRARIRSEFAARRRRQYLLAGPLVAAALAVALAADKGPGALLGVPASVWGPLFLVAVAGGALYSFHNWRCPACGRWLGRTIFPRYCVKCGAPLV